MLWRLVARVKQTVVLRKQINVVEHEAVVAVFFHRFPDACVHQLRFVECKVAGLQNTNLIGTTRYRPQTRQHTLA